MSLEERFDAKWTRSRSSACMQWIGALTTAGYGQISIAGQLKYAHRVAYERWVGPIPVGLVIDHLCRNPSCVNPVHLEPVSNRENVLRGVAPSAKNAKKTHCKNGHPLSGENLSVRNKGHRTERHCKACHRDYMRQRRSAS